MQTSSHTLKGSFLQQRGFTIVELLIVIVVIGILVAITIVVFNGVSRSAAGATLKSDLRNAQVQLETARDDSGNYPANPNMVRLSDGTELEYTPNGNTYCMTVSSLAALTNFYVDSVAPSIIEGTCTGHLGIAGLLGVPPPAPSQVAVGEQHTCALIGGLPYCWGTATNGRLGNNSAVSSLTPTPVDISGALAGKAISQIGSDHRHTCVLADGAPYCWGLNDSGQIGDGTTTSPGVPTATNMTGVLAGKTVTQISVGGSHTCAIADGLAYCWGGNVNGRLGTGNTTASSNPIAVNATGVLAGKQVTYISAGGTHSCAVADGEAFCWGSGSSGQIGRNSSTNALTPAAVDTSGVLNGRTVTQIHAGGNHTCALADGLPFCWGLGTSGQLGQGAALGSQVPVAVSTSGVLSGRTVTFMAASSNNSCVIADALPFCWGSNNTGRLGNGSTTNSSVPVAVTATGALSGRVMTHIDIATNHSCVIGDGVPFCWGVNSADGRFGNGTTTNSSVPVAVDPMPSL